jgi:P pilus assembly chaperone PapD
MRVLGGVRVSAEGVTPYLIVTRPPKQVEMGQDRRIKVTLGGGKLPKREGGMRYVALVTPSKKDGKGKNQVDAPTMAKQLFFCK